MTICISISLQVYQDTVASFATGSVDDVSSFWKFRSKQDEYTPLRNDTGFRKLNTSKPLSNFHRLVSLGSVYIHVFFRNTSRHVFVGMSQSR